MAGQLFWGKNILKSDFSTYECILMLFRDNKDYVFCIFLLLLHVFFNFFFLGSTRFGKRSRGLSRQWPRHQYVSVTVLVLLRVPVLLLFLSRAFTELKNSTTNEPGGSCLTDMCQAVFCNTMRGM